MNILLILALLVAVPCIIAMVKATDAKARIIPGLAVLAAAIAGSAPYLQRHAGSLDVGQIGWIATGVMAVIAGVRISHPIYSTLIYTGAALGLLLQFGAITAR